jgi:AcrR family transcriptional regulator
VAAKSEAAVRRRPRADGERNRNRLLETAKAAFAAKGSAASLDEIARAADVGIGTLYRHFPTRDALIEAVYRNESEQLAAAAARLSEREAPLPALRKWLLLFVDYMAAKRGMVEALNTIVGDASEIKAASGARLREAIGTLVDRAIASGDIRLEMEPLDLLYALAGVANTTEKSKKVARRLVDILIAGMRTKSSLLRQLDQIPDRPDALDPLEWDAKGLPK